MAAAALLAGCAGGGKDNGGAVGGARRGVGPGVTLPARITQAHVLKVASVADHRPMEFPGLGGTVQGVDVDVCQALVRELGGGLGCRFEATDDPLGVLGGGRDDIAMAGIRDTPAGAAGVDVIEYLNATTSIPVDAASSQLEPGRYGILVRTTDRPLRDALGAALRAAIADGTYGQVLGRWGLASAAVNAGP